MGAKLAGFLVPSQHPGAARRCGPGHAQDLAAARGFWTRWGTPLLNAMLDAEPEPIAKSPKPKMTDPASEWEPERLAALYNYEILDTPPDGAFDRVTALAARHFDVPVALVSLVDEDRIWFKSRYGLDADQIPRSPGLCASVIFSDSAYVVKNAIADPRTLANPLVAGKMGVRFYAAAPLVTHDGYRLGTMNIIDFTPREFDSEGERTLHQFAGLVMDQMELRLSARKAIASLTQIFLGAERSKEIRNLITVSAWSRKIQVDGEWVSFEEFLVDKLGVSITHGIDPEAAQRLLGEMERKKRSSSE